MFGSVVGKVTTMPLISTMPLHDRYPVSDPRNTWNGAIIRGSDGVYHLYNPIYPAGELGGSTTMLHGTSNSIAGPYEWGKQPDITITPKVMTAFDGPKSVVYTDPSTNKTKYSLWLGGGVYLADSLDGPFTKLVNFKYPGSNPAPVWYKGAFYHTNSPCMKIYTTPHLVSGAKWVEYGSIDHSVLPEGWLAEVNSVRYRYYALHSSCYMYCKSNDNKKLHLMRDNNNHRSNDILVIN